MANKMLIDATHPEETRVVVVRGNRVEEFDFESAHRRQLRGNIYLAKVTRVEPSLQAAFVEYGGNRHGFLAFSEIHPDYYQIPVADRQALIDEEERAHRDAEAEADRRAGGGGGGGGRRRHHRAAAESSREAVRSAPIDGGEVGESDIAETNDPGPGGDIATDVAVEPMALPETAGLDADHDAGPAEGAPAEPQAHAHDDAADAEPHPHHDAAEASADHAVADAADPVAAAHAAGDEEAADGTERGSVAHHQGAEHDGADQAEQNGAEHDGAEQDGAEHAGADHDEAPENGGDGEEEEVVESVGGADAMEEVPDRMPRLRRQYKIQEVIKRRQIMLVQVVKEERGTKGAALTTYLSLAGRYSVLMPNTARGGGISRKITNAQDRKRLKSVAQELEVPDGMGVILRTAGANRTKAEIKRDFEYLIRLWETVRDLTLKSTAPTLVYEEGSLIKRSIRDLYNKDIEEVQVAGEAGYQEARDFMKMLMPSNVRAVKQYRDSQPIFTRHGIESQLDAMFSPVVQLKSGGYIVLNQAEALVAIDVNSGRATREHHIEDTALKTNLEAADEVARQLRLRDLAGLIVIDFIDMDEKRNNRSVERRLKECLKHDRARIQVGHISHFGLLEMSRQRIRTSVLESSTEKCPHCGGSGHVRSVSSVALQLLRAIEEQLIRGATHNLIARTRPDVALYVLNQKRAHLRGLEDRFAITITVSADETVRAPQTFVIDRGEQVHTPEAAKAIAERAQAAVTPLEEEDDLEEISAEASEAEQADFERDAEIAVPASAEASEGGSRRRRRRRRRGRGGENMHNDTVPHVEQIAITESSDDRAAEAHDGLQDEAVSESAGGFAAEPHEGREGPRRDERRRRRGRRGGRRNRLRNDESGYGAPGPSEHYAQGELAAAEEFIAPAATEPALSHTVADRDSPPTERAAPPEVAAVVPPAEAAQPEISRRRSTVREPVPRSRTDAIGPDTTGTDTTGAEGAGNNPASEASQGPEPLITETSDASDGERPRRTGWW